MGMANRDFFTENTLHPRMFSLLLLSATFVLFSGCGGDSEEETQVSAEEVTVNESLSSEETLSDVPDEPVDQVISSPKEEQKEAPNPNGIFLPIFEDNGGKQVASQLNNKPAYSNGKGYFMWSNGSNWKITTKLGGGRVISTGGEKLLDPWSGGGKARHAPDEEYTKQAMFRLAVAYQGSEDNENAIRLYKQFVTLFPDDKMVAEAYLGLGDLAISGVSPDSQPTFEQITQARENYAMVREKTQQIGLISDSTFNEGGLIERVAENPEGLINYFFTFDKDENEVISKDEFAGIQAKFPDLSSFETYDLSTDGSLDFGELYDVAASNSYKNLEQIYQNYAEKFGSMEGAQIAQATEKIGFALEKQGKPSKMLSLYYEDIKKFGNDPTSVGVDAILKKYCDKYKEYEDLFGLTLDLLQKLQNPAEPVSFTFRNRKGIEEEISGTIEEIVKDRSKVLAF